MKKFLLFTLILLLSFTTSNMIKAEERTEVDADWHVEVEPNVIDLNESGGITKVSIYHDQNRKLDTMTINAIAHHKDITDKNSGVNYITDSSMYTYASKDNKKDYYVDKVHSGKSKTQSGIEYEWVTYQYYRFVDVEVTDDCTSYMISTDEIREILLSDFDISKNNLNKITQAAVSLFNVNGFYADETTLLNFDTRRVFDRLYKVKYPDYKIDENDKEIVTIISKEPTLDIVKKNKDLAWEHKDGKSYWYEKVNGKFVKQGTYFDTNGVMGDGTIRGREIFDPDSNAWYWLDAIYDGAKAVAKEVWMPYIYQDEDSFTSKQLDQVVKDSNTYTESTTKANMGEQVKKAILNKEGKWVRYDENGKMYKGWVKLENWKEKPEQNGNTYYYDYKTGLMAKGKTIIDGKEYHFDEVTGVCKNPPVQYR